MTFEQCDRKLARLVSRYAAGQLTDEAYLRGIHQLGPVWSRMDWQQYPPAGADTLAERIKHYDEVAA